MTNEWGAQSVWCGDHRYILHWQRHDVSDEVSYINWWVSKPNLGKDRTEEDALMDGIITKFRWEWETIGALDIAPHDTFEILGSVRRLRDVL